MRKIFTVLALIGLPLCLQAQKTIINSGNWTDVGSWASGDIANGPTSADNVIMNSTRAITVQGGENIASGSISSGNGNTITVASTGHLEVGDASNPQSITAGVNMAIVANDGVIIIWGDLIVNNNLAITIQGPTGAIIIKGNIIMSDNASLIVNGTLTVGGDFTGGNNTGVTVGTGGAINVDGTLTVGPGSHVNLNCDPGPTNCGTFHAHSCGADVNSQAFCSSGLPIHLMSFTAEPTERTIKFHIATATETNFDYFLLEKSTDGKAYTEVATVSGHGTSIDPHEYQMEDERPAIGRNYYRLSEVDLDHSVVRLRILVVEFTGKKSLDVFPNPVVAGEVTLKFNFVLDGKADISIMDLRGTILSEFVIDRQEVTLPVTLGSGTYLVQSRSHGFRSVSRLVVK